MFHLNVALDAITIFTNRDLPLKERWQALMMYEGEGAIDADPTDEAAECGLTVEEYMKHELELAIESI